MAKGNEKKKPKYQVEKDSKEENEPKSRFAVGDKPSGFYQNKNFTPVFAFNHVSLEASELCYNHPHIPADLYHRFFDRLKVISNVTYENMKQGGKFYRFHSVDYEDENVSVTLLQFKKTLSNTPDKLKDDDVPTLYQFDVFHKSRAFGYLGYMGIFHIVWLDPGHEVYEENNIHFFRTLKIFLK